jgi:putative selenium metabolism protein SsnA
MPLNFRETYTVILQPLERAMILANAILATLGNAPRLITSAALRVVGDRITEIGTAQELLNKYPAETVTDLKGQLVLPGAICSHTHFYGAFARGMALPGPAPANFPEILRRIWWTLDKALSLEDIRWSAFTFLADAVRHGVTTIMDHHASPNAIEGSLETIAEAAMSAGVRVCLAYEVSDRDGPEIAKRGISENQRFIRALKDEPAAHRGYLAGSFGLHASFTLTPETLTQAVEANAELGTGFHIHVAEDRIDEEDARSKYSMSTVERLESAGILGDKTIAAHCVHALSDEVDILARTGTLVVHNPRSNMNNAVGTLKAEELLSRGVALGLGNDGFSMNMFQEMKVAYLVHKAARGDPRAMPASSVLHMAYNNNARIARQVFSPFFRSGSFVVGELSPGSLADLVVLDYRPPTPLTVENLPWHVIFGVDGTHVASTMVGGRWIMWNRELVTLDEEKIAHHAERQAAHLWRRMLSR